MSEDEPDFPAPDENEPSPTDAEQEGPARLPSGRFGPGYCGNRKGRPRKREPSTPERLDRILGMKTPSNNPAFADLDLEDGILLSMCLQGLKNYRAGLAVITLRTSLRGASLGELPSDEEVPGGDDALNNFVEREIRRRRLQSGTSDDAAPDGIGGDDQSGGDDEEDST